MQRKRLPPPSSADPLPIDQATHTVDDQTLAELQRTVRSTRNPHQSQKQQRSDLPKPPIRIGRDR